MTPTLTRPPSLRSLLDAGEDPATFLPLDDLASVATAGRSVATDDKRALSAAWDRHYVEAALAGEELALGIRNQEGLVRTAWSAEVRTDDALADRVAALLSEEVRREQLEFADLMKRPYELITSDRDTFRCTTCGETRTGPSVALMSRWPAEDPLLEVDPVFCLDCITSAMAQLQPNAINDDTEEER